MDADVKEDVVIIAVGGLLFSYFAAAAAADSADSVADVAMVAVMAVETDAAGLSG